MVSAQGEDVLGRGWFVEASSSKVPKYKSLVLTLKGSDYPYHDVDIFKEGIIYDSITLENDVPYEYKCVEYGEFTIYNGNESITEWEVTQSYFDFNDVKTLYLNGEEVVNIIDNDFNFIFGDNNIEDFENTSLTVTGESFTTYNDNPFDCTGPLLVDWGDGDTEAYVKGKLSHTYADDYDEHEINIKGTINAFNHYCFRNCTGLTSITIPNSITSIGNNCFQNCNSLTSITIPNSITSIGNYCFDYCNSLTSITIPSSVATIGNYCFRNCDSLSWVNMSSNITSLPVRCFYNCVSLESIEIPNGVTSIGSYCFYNCDSLTNITIPNNVETLGSYCFYECDGLTSITLPNSIKSLPLGCFRSCDSLEYVYMGKGSNVESIGNYCFEGCGSLKTIYNLSTSNVTALGNYCFRKCVALKEIYIPTSVTSIGDYCFKECTSLKYIFCKWTFPVRYNSNWITDAYSKLYFIIPYGATNRYINYGYPSSKIWETT